MYPASSRHRDRRPRSARKTGPNRRPLLEALEPRQLMAASTSVSWVKVESPNIATATNGSEMYTTNGSWLNMYVGPQEMATVAASGSVTAATDGHAYTSDVAKYGLSGGLHLEWSHAGYFPNVSDVDAADDGSVYLVGTYRTAFDADPGPGTHMLADPIVFGRNAYIAKLDADGNFLWASIVGGDEGSGHASLDQYNAVQLDVDPAGNAYVAVNYVTGVRPPFEGGGAVLMKFAASGQGGWREAIGDFRSAVTRLAASPDGSGVAVAISGPTLTAEDLVPVASTSSVEHYPSSGGTPPNNSFVARYDAAGALVWARQPEINSDPRNVGAVTAMDISPRGDVLVAAGANDGVAPFSLVQRYDALGNLLSRQAYDGLVITSIADSDSQIHLNITGTFSGTVDIDPGYVRNEITVPAGATSAGVIFRLIDPSGGSERLLGTPIGTPGSWNNSGNDLTKALDNNYSSYFDAPTSQAWVGYDFGHATIVDHVEYIPRTGYEFRMVGGQFQGSNDGSNWTTVATITATPKTGTRNFLGFAAPVTYRYMRYLSPVDGFGNAAEISFNGAGPEAYPPDVPLHPTTSWDGTRVWVNWTDLATNETGYRAELFTNPDFTGTPVAVAERGSNFHSLYFSDFNTPGTYYVRVLAYNSYSRSPWASAGSVTIPAAPPVAPAAPTDIVPISNNGTVQFSWRDNATNETGYAIELSLDPNFAPANDLVNTIVSANTTGHSYGPPTPGLTYYFRVRAVNATSAGTAYSAYATASTVYRPPTDVPDQLVGTPIGTPGSWNNTGAVFTHALDGQTNTFFDAPTSQAYVGYDFGTPATVTRVYYYPRIGNAERMVGGQIRGSNDNVNWTTLATINSVPAYGFNTLDIPNPAAFRYVEYLSPVGGFGNVAELKFAGTRGDTTLPAAPTGLTVTAGLNKLTVNWTDNATNETGYTVEYSPSPDFTPGTPGAGSALLSANATSDTRLVNPGVTYYVRVRATSAAGSSAYATAGPVKTTAVRLTGGTPIGTPGSWNNSGNDITKAFDGATSSYFDAPTSQAYVGLDFGTPTAVSSVTFYARVGQEARMNGGTFRVSDDGVNWTTVAGIGFVPQPNTPYTLNFADPTPHRYVSYLSPADGWGNVAELQFFGTPATVPTPPAAPTGVTGVAETGTSSPSSIRVLWTDNANNETGYQVQASTTADFSAHVITINTPANPNGAVLTSLTAGTYYIRVRALGSGDVNSAWVSAASPVTLGPPVTGNELVGTIIGTEGSWNNSGNDRTKAFDGDTSTFFDAPIGDAWVGLDLGTARTVDRVRFFPRAGLAWRMVDGTFQGSNDGVNWTTLATIRTEPTEGTYTEMSLGGGIYRYVRYQGAAWGSGNVAELKFYGPGEPVPAPAAPTSVSASTTASIHMLMYSWADNATNETGYQYQLSTSADFSTVFRTETVAANTRAVELYNIPDGTYYFRVRATGNGTASAFSTAAPIRVDNNAVQLTGGTPIGTPGSWNNFGNDITKVFDGATSSYFDAPTSQAYVGLDFGTPVTVTQVDYYARVGQEARMVGGQFRVSNDGVNWTTVYTVTDTPRPNVPYYFAVPNPGAYRFLSYLSPEGGYGNIAEMRAYGYR